MLLSHRTVSSCRSHMHDPAQPPFAMQTCMSVACPKLWPRRSWNNSSPSMDASSPPASLSIRSQVSMGQRLLLFLTTLCTWRDATPSTLPSSTLTCRELDGLWQVRLVCTLVFLSSYLSSEAGVLFHTLPVGFWRQDICQRWSNTAIHCRKFTLRYVERH